MSSSCCGGSPDSGPRAEGDAASVLETQQKYHDFLKSANAPGTLDARTVRAVCENPP
jgi:hypothetical protein